MMPLASSSFTRFQQGVVDRPTASASCCTVWRASRWSSLSSRMSWRSSALIPFSCLLVEHYSPEPALEEKTRTLFPAGFPKLGVPPPEPPETIAMAAQDLQDAPRTTEGASPIRRPDYRLSDS